MACQFEECRGKRILQLCKSDHNKENYPNNRTAIQKTAQETKEEEGDQNIELPSQSAQENKDEEEDQNIDVLEKSAQVNEYEGAARNIRLFEMESNSNVRKDKKRLARVAEWLSVKAKTSCNIVNLDLIIWHEEQANRGVDEIGTCLLDFINGIMAEYDGMEMVFFR
ncbi:hypothetical protein HHI36_019838 [Cryptolaemus montrouzieri]|uniref:Uncharacterized protein n=1 Tax=Cryptolaemus montrouzieri TaxID=559131 RepID=A0ABD2NA12_9CUCU